MNEETPILFLDFDGVLNSYEEGSYMTNKDETYGPSETICRRLRTLCEKTGARIIISSNWRKFDPDGYYIFEDTKVHNPLKKVENILGDLIIGRLPPYRHVTKAEALILWIEENDFDYKNTKWAVVDDDPEENLGSTHDYGISNHYVQTDMEFGLTEDKISEIESIIMTTRLKRK